MSLPAAFVAPISRREALRRTVLFSAAALAGRSASVFADAPATTFSEKGLHFLALGDYGTKGDPGQTSVANAMGTFAKSLDQPLEAVLALGDNFYREITPERFENHFEKLYSATDLNCPFYACAGNHDYGTAKYDEQDGKLQMQLDYATNNPQSRWKFPSKWYTLELPNPEKPLVKIIVLDGNYWEGGLTPKEKLAQRRFFQAELKKKNNAPWLWVVNHFPLYSETSKRGDNSALIRDWGKLLKDERISLIFAGHDHTMQHLTVDGYSASFIVNGAGGARLYDVRPAKRGFVDNKSLGFNHIHLTPEEVHVQFINADGQCLHQFKRDLAGKMRVVT